MGLIDFFKGKLWVTRGETTKGNVTFFYDISADFHSYFSQEMGLKNLKTSPSISASCKSEVFVQIPYVGSACHGQQGISATY